MANNKMRFPLNQFIAGLVFLGVGVAIGGFLLLPAMIDWVQMKSWVQNEASVMDAELSSNRGENSMAFSAQATYAYLYKNKSYQNDRVTIISGSDSVGDYQQDMHKRLNKNLHSEELIQIWVDPDNPQDSIIDREMRWGQFSLLGLFALIFGCAGFFTVRNVFDSPRNNDVDQRIAQD